MRSMVEGAPSLRRVTSGPPPPRRFASRSPSPSRGGSRSSLQLDVPVEVAPPALVEIIGREGAAVLLELPAGRAEGAAADLHMGLGRGAAAFPEVAGRAGGGDIVPGRAPALGARQDMVEGELMRVAAILAGE